MGKAPKRKKITRLIPADESLPSIEEGTERSEDSTVITSSPDLLSRSIDSGSSDEEGDEKEQGEEQSSDDGVSLQASASADSASSNKSAPQGDDSSDQAESPESTPATGPQQQEDKPQSSGKRAKTEDGKPPPAKKAPEEHSEDSTGTEKMTDDDDSAGGSAHRRIAKIEPGSNGETPVAERAAAPAESAKPESEQNEEPKADAPASEDAKSNSKGEASEPAKPADSRPQSEKSDGPAKVKGEAKAPPGKGHARKDPKSNTGKEGGKAKGGAKSEGAKSQQARSENSKSPVPKGSESPKPPQKSEKPRTKPPKPKSESPKGADSSSDVDDKQEDGVSRSDLFDFDNELDDSEGSDEKEEILTWRLDPSESLSDWTIAIKRKETAQVDTYHVHKNMLAVGPRKSEYFVQVFRNAAKKGNLMNEQKSEIEIESVAANIFPLFLDFIYSSEGDLEITTTNATGLRFLASFFGVRVLFKKVMQFIEKDLDLKTVAAYYRDVIKLRDEKLLRTIAKYCGKFIMKVDKSFSLLEVFDPVFFTQIIFSADLDGKDKKYHISTLVAEYCRINQGKLDQKHFLALTDEKLLPLVHFSAALVLLELEADIVVNRSMTSLLDMSSLQKRCVKELSAHWREVRDMDTDQVTKVCRKLPSSVVTELLIKSFALGHPPKRRSLDGTRSQIPHTVEGRSSSNHERSTISSSASTGSTGSSERPPTGPPRNEPPAELHNSDGSINNSGHSRPKDKAAKRVDPKNMIPKKEADAKIEKLKTEHQEEMTILKLEYEANLVKLRDMLLDKDQQIAKFWQELKSFERLPNSHDGKLAASGRQHEATVIPEIARGGPEGYLLVTKKNGPKYPLFYYKKEDKDHSSASGASGGK